MITNTASTLLGRQFIYREDIDSSVTLVVVKDAFSLALVHILIHVIVNAFGKYYVEVEILRKGNDELLDELEEGVVIQEESTKRVIYMNQSAKSLGSKKSNANEPSASTSLTSIDQIFGGGPK